jgi:membrane-associated phospholipid phosphatase
MSLATAFIGFALICCFLFPLAPPRLLPELSFVDTQKVFGSNLYNQKSVVSLYNPYAAMPSPHFGCALLVGIMAFSFDRKILKAAGVLYPCCMAIVIVTSGHHYVLDIVGGGVVVSLAYGLTRAFPRAKRILVPVSLGAGLFSANALEEENAKTAGS